MLVKKMMKTNVRDDGREKKKKKDEEQTPFEGGFIESLRAGKS